MENNGFRRNTAKVVPCSSAIQFTPLLVVCATSITQSHFLIGLNLSADFRSSFISQRFFKHGLMQDQARFPWSSILDQPRTREYSRVYVLWRNHKVMRKKNTKMIIVYHSVDYVQHRFNWIVLKVQSPSFRAQDQLDFLC